MNSNELKEFIVRWNNKFPFDRFWRKKYNIPFLSPEHRACSFLSQKFEFEEDMLFSKLEKDEKNKDKQPEYIPNIGSWLKEEEVIQINERGEQEIGKITERDVENFLEEVRAIEGSIKKDG